MCIEPLLPEAALARRGTQAWGHTPCCFYVLHVVCLSTWLGGGRERDRQHVAPDGAIARTKPTCPQCRHDITSRSLIPGPPPQPPPQPVEVEEEVPQPPPQPEEVPDDLLRYVSGRMSTEQARLWACVTTCTRDEVRSQKARRLNVWSGREARRAKAQWTCPRVAHIYADRYFAAVADAGTTREREVVYEAVEFDATETQADMQIRYVQHDLHGCSVRPHPIQAVTREQIRASHEGDLTPLNKCGACRLGCACRCSCIVSSLACDCVFRCGRCAPVSRERRAPAAFPL